MGSIPFGVRDPDDWVDRSTFVSLLRRIVSFDIVMIILMKLSLL
jgi:hypothetical protein